MLLSTLLLKSQSFKMTYGAQRNDTQGPSEFYVFSHFSSNLGHTEQLLCQTAYIFFLCQASSSQYVPCLVMLCLLSFLFACSSWKTFAALTSQRTSGYFSTFNSRFVTSRKTCLILPHLTTPILLSTVYFVHIFIICSIFVHLFLHCHPQLDHKHLKKSLLVFHLEPLETVT